MERPHRVNHMGGDFELVRKDEAAKVKFGHEFPTLIATNLCYWHDGSHRQAEAGQVIPVYRHPLHEWDGWVPIKPLFAGDLQLKSGFACAWDLLALLGQKNGQIEIMMVDDKPAYMRPRKRGGPDGRNRPPLVVQSEMRKMSVPELQAIQTANQDFIAHNPAPAKGKGGKRTSFSPGPKGVPS